MHVRISLGLLRTYLHVSTLSPYSILSKPAECASQDEGIKKALETKFLGFFSPPWEGFTCSAPGLATV